MQVKGNANFNSGNPDSKKYSEEASRFAYESSLSSQSCDECWTSLPNNLHRPGVKHVVDQDSDDSDSEIFRVKRRTSLKVDKRDVNEAIRAKHSDHQVYFVDVLISNAYIGGLNYLILGTLETFQPWFSTSIIMYLFLELF
jgi:hypothetical protein